MSDEDEGEMIGHACAAVLAVLNEQLEGKSESYRKKLIATLVTLMSQQVKQVRVPHGRRTET